MGYSAKAVANYFIDKAKRAGNPVDHLKLQKLVYLAHGWHLALHENNAPLVENEYPEAWKYGPVFPSVYHELKEHGGRPIKERATEVDVNEDGQFYTFTPVIPSVDEETSRFLDRVFEVYKNCPGVRLSRMTHKPDSPWAEARKRSNRINENILPKDLIEHFQEQLK